MSSRGPTPSPETTLATSHSVRIVRDQGSSLVKFEELVDRFMSNAVHYMGGRPLADCSKIPTPFFPKLSAIAIVLLSMIFGLAVSVG